MCATNLPQHQAAVNIGPGTFRVVATDDHLRRGRPLCLWGCPVGLAGAEAVPGVRLVHVSATTVFFLRHAGDGHLGDLPHHVVRWVADFDAMGRNAVGPLAFDLSVAPVRGDFLADTSDGD